MSRPPKSLNWSRIFMAEMMSDPDSEKTVRVMEALLRMKKLDFEELQRAYEGTAGVGARGGR
jgi:hypothetical protein